MSTILFYSSQYYVENMLDRKIQDENSRKDELELIKKGLGDIEFKKKWFIELNKMYKILKQQISDLTLEKVYDIFVLHCERIICDENEG